MPLKNSESPSTFGLGDIYLTVFRHKWKILALALCGLIAGAVIYTVSTPGYVSTAKVLVRYVQDNAALNPVDKDDRVRSPDERGATIMNSEIQILTSRDLSEQVVDLIGPDKILARTGGGTNRGMAVATVLTGLKVEVPPKTSVIAITYEHPDPDIARQVLKALVDRYLERHLEIHRAVGAYDFLSRQTDQLRARLNQTEEDAHKLRTNAGVFSVEESKKSLSEEMAQIRTAISAAEVELESRKAALQERQKWLVPATNQTNVAGAPKPAPYQLGLYSTLMERLQKLRVQEIEMLGKYTETNPIVQSLQLQITDLEKRRVEMETANPQLALTSTAGPNALPQKDGLLDDSTQIVALNARMNVLKTQWTRVIARIGQIEGVENNLKEIDRRRELEEQHFRYFSASLERARIDQALDASKISNISVVQAASLPALAMLPILKKSGIAAGVGLGLGMAFAFLLDFMGGPKVQRPADFGRHVMMPLLLTIPDKEHRQPQLLAFLRRKRDGTAKPVQVTVWDSGHPLRGYFEALRDRLLVLFNNDPRRPKLVGITACSRAAGSSSIAAGLAATLSETGDGKVLLVDLNQEHGAAHQYFRGRPTCALNDAHEETKRGQGLIQENLYLATLDQINGERRTLIPSKKVAELMPRLRTADYDYIIFDMPPVSHTSITFRVAGMLDTVLLVAESEKTHRGMLEEAHALLRESNSTVYGVLNKHRRHIPKFLHEELNGSH
jgi:polysaccharide biosynthesis transport protein